jgi:hypothetical protein
LPCFEGKAYLLRPHRCVHHFASPPGDVKPRCTVIQLDQEDDAIQCGNVSEGNDSESQGRSPSLILRLAPKLRERESPEPGGNRGPEEDGKAADVSM